MKVGCDPNYAKNLYMIWEKGKRLKTRRKAIRIIGWKNVRHSKPFFTFLCFRKAKIIKQKKRNFSQDPLMKVG